jgi:hypothetical protein
MINTLMLFPKAPRPAKIAHNSPQEKCGKITRRMRGR